MKRARIPPPLPTYKISTFKKTSLFLRRALLQITRILKMVVAKLDDHVPVKVSF